MKNRSSEVLELREKMDRFNAWERTFTRQLSDEERFIQFNDLFELGMRFDNDVRERAHREHLVPFARFARALNMKKS